MTLETFQQWAERRVGRWPATLVWSAAWGIMLALEARLDLANLAMILVLASVVDALWLSPFECLLACTLSVLAFNWIFVPPQGSFTVHLHQHALLIVTTLTVSWIVALLMARQRLLAVRERRHAHRAENLRAMSEALRDTDDPIERGSQLREALAQLMNAPVTLLMLKGQLPSRNDRDACLQLGPAGVDEQTGLWMCLRDSRAFGPGTGRHQEQDAWYLPMRGRGGSFGAALVSIPGAPTEPTESTGPADPAELRANAQALCDLMGLALERALTVRRAAQAREEAHSQKLRNTLLAAISHDYRTPLAAIMGAASSLHDQGDRLSSEQQQRLAAMIVDEADQLSRLTDNTLQLVRLDAPGLALHLDWESAEEIVGSVLRRVRKRDPVRRVHARIDTGLPLLRCDAVLLVQLLENLVDNALKYSDDATPVEIFARTSADRLVIAVGDRGAGISPAWHERIFDVFQRGEHAGAPVGPSLETAAPRGAGVGLAVCRAIARAHGGQLTLRARSHGGTSFECSLPLVNPPNPAAATAEAATS